MILKNKKTLQSKLVLCALFTTVLLFGACDPDLLNTNPDDRYTVGNFWESETAVTAALNGAYRPLRYQGVFGRQASPAWEDAATPNLFTTSGIGFSNIALGQQDPTSGSVMSWRWSHSYDGVGRTNTFLARIDEAEGISEEDRARMTGEVHFLRALYYFILATYYGDVPLILDPPDVVAQAELPRTPREEVIGQVLADLEQAAGLLPLSYSGSDEGRATRGAALGLKARVLLYEASPLHNPQNDLSRWQAAADAAQEVIGLGVYDLFPDYHSLFLPENQNSEEVVFDVQYISPQVEPGLGTSWDLINIQHATTAPLQELIDAFHMEDGLPYNESPLYDPEDPYMNRDPRFYTTVVYPGARFQNDDVTGTTYAHTGYALRKYTVYSATEGNPPANVSDIKDGQSHTNYMVIRYADILLSYAEALNEYSGPDQRVYDAINQVRERAEMPHIETGHSQDELREIIRHERRIEFVGEGLFYNDIRRWRTIEELNNGPVHRWDGQLRSNRSFNPDRDYWWPIQQSELDLNPNLEQNPGY